MSFYSKGLRFKCSRCSRCCRHTPGYVFLTRSDLVGLVKATGLTEEGVLEKYCREVNIGGFRRVSLKEKANLDCIFWEDGGCSMYHDRPLQCRSFPFWNLHLYSEESWQKAAKDCPGIGQGSLHSEEEIRDWLNKQVKEVFL